MSVKVKTQGNKSRLRRKPKRANGRGVGRPRHEDKRVHPIQVALNSAELAILQALREQVAIETGMEVNNGVLLRSLMLKEAQRRGIIPARQDIPADSSPTPAPHSPAAQTTRSRTARTDPPPSAPDSTPTGPHYRRSPASSKKGGG